MLTPSRLLLGKRSVHSAALKMSLKPITLMDSHGKPTFDASSLHALLLDNGQHAGTLQRIDRSRSPLLRPIHLQPRAPKYSLRSAPEQQPATEPAPVPQPCADFPADLTSDAKMAYIPPYAALPPSVASIRRRRGLRAKTKNVGVASPLLELATVATAGGPKTSRLPQHAHLKL